MIRGRHECATRYIPKGQAERLIRALGQLCSEEQREALNSETFVIGRESAEVRSVFISAAEIRRAMRESKKIKFKYATASIDDVKKTAFRRYNTQYTVSPYALLVNDGNLYMFAYSDWNQEFWTYRVDRMRDVTCTNTGRTGYPAFLKIDIESYLRRVFGMYHGERQRVVMEFDKSAIDAVVDRLGTEDIVYHSEDKKHFYVNADIEVSPQFYAWVFGFGDKAKIKAPASVVGGMEEHIKKVAAVYAARE